MHSYLLIYYRVVVAFVKGNCMLRSIFIFYLPSVTFYLFCLMFYVFIVLHFALQ